MCKAFRVQGPLRACKVSRVQALQGPYRVSPARDTDADQLGNGLIQQRSGLTSQRMFCPHGAIATSVSLRRLCPASHVTRTTQRRVPWRDRFRFALNAWITSSATSWVSSPQAAFLLNFISYQVLANCRGGLRVQKSRTSCPNSSGKEE